MRLLWQTESKILPSSSPEFSTTLAYGWGALVSVRRGILAERLDRR